MSTLIGGLMAVAMLSWFLFGCVAVVATLVLPKKPKQATDIEKALDKLIDAKLKQREKI